MLQTKTLVSISDLIGDQHWKHYLPTGTTQAPATALCGCICNHVYPSGISVAGRLCPDCLRIHEKGR